MSRRVVVVGSSNTDMVLQLARIPRPGETILGGAFSMLAGGKGANQAVAAARAGGQVTLIARVGRDMFGEQAIRGFEAEGIDVANVLRDERAASGVALIFVAADGENSIGVAGGANALLSPEDVRRAESVIRSAAILLMQLETQLETVKAAAEIAASAGVRVILNPAPAQPLPDDLLARLSIVTPNETEAELLTGIAVNDTASATRAAAVLRSRGAQTAIVTLGARGAFVSGEGIEELVPSYPVKAVDTTAAGDVFNGALAVALSEGRSLRDAVQFANGAAALSVTKLGAQPSAPGRKDIDTFVRR